MTIRSRRASLPSRERVAYGPRMRFLVLGPLEVTGDDGPIGLGGPKQRAVLAHLLVRANQVVPAEALIDRLWGDEPPDTARNTLQTYVSHLRKALGSERLEGRAPGYVLHVQPDELDATRFEALVREARAADGQPDRVRDLLSEALGLWRGRAFADLDANGLAGEIARLDELRIQATEARLSADLEAGRHVEVVGELESLTREFPLRERLWSLLMLALYQSGRQADALAAFQRARDSPGRRARRRSLAGAPTTPRADPATGRRPRDQGGAAPRVPAAREDRRGRVRRRLSRDPAARRSRGRREVDPPRPGEPARFRPAVRARGAAGRAPGAPARRPALRLLARARRGVPRHAVPPRRDGRGSLGDRRARRRTHRSDPRPDLRRRSRRRTGRASSTGT